MTAKEFENITQILDLIAQLNINRCAATTYDLGVQECARHEIIQGIARHYDVVWHKVPHDEKIFPVKGSCA
jgi:predicted transposase YbfD/YdcC